MSEHSLSEHSLSEHSLSEHSLSENNLPENSLLETWETRAAWGLDLQAWRCPACDWRYLAASDAPVERCPHCCRAALTPLALDAAQRPYHAPPELVLPATVDASVLEQQIKAFAGDIPFAPHDLNAESLRSRLRLLWLPMWLVDAAVAAQWRAEVGFDYGVVSHQEHYRDGVGWESQQVEETRVRWEPRAGRLQRHYDNVAAPALETHAALEAQLGAYQRAAACAYTAAQMRQALVRLPDRPPEAAWPSAVPGFQQAAAEECRQAAQAEHIQQFAWAPGYQSQHWTLLLMPVYATHYLDDEGQPQPVLIHGQSGRVSGARRASMQRAQRTALVSAVVAAVILVVSLCLAVVGLALPPLIILALIVGGLSLIGGPLGVLAPLIIVSRFNRRQQH